MEYVFYWLFSWLLYIVELVQLIVEKSFQRSCCFCEDNVNYDELNGERVGKLKFYDFGIGVLISRVLYLDSFFEILLFGIGSLECICQKKLVKISYNQFCYFIQKGFFFLFFLGYSFVIK